MAFSNALWPGALDERQHGDDRAAGGEFENFILVVRKSIVRFIFGGGRDNLQRVETGTVGDVNKGKPGFGIPAGADPAGNGDGRADFSFAGQNRRD